MKRFQKGVSVLLAILVMLSSVATWAVFAEGEFALTAVDGTAGNSGEGLDKLFDGDLESKYCTMNDTAYIVAKLSSAQPINAYSLTSADQSARDPAAWVCLLSLRRSGYICSFRRGKCCRSSRKLGVAESDPQKHPAQRIRCRCI